MFPSLPLLDVLPMPGVAAAVSPPPGRLSAAPAVLAALTELLGGEVAGDAAPAEPGERTEPGAPATPTPRALGRWGAAAPEEFGDTLAAVLAAVVAPPPSPTPAPTAAAPAPATATAPAPPPVLVEESRAGARDSSTSMEWEAPAAPPQAAQHPLLPRVVDVADRPVVVHDVERTLVAGVRALHQRPDGTLRLVVRLDPPELGPVHVDITSRGDDVFLTLHVATDDAQVGIESRRDAIETALRREGLTLADFDVSSHGRRERPHGEPHADGRPRVLTVPLPDPDPQPTPSPTDGALLL